MIPLSPSNAGTFRQCPLKFHAQYVTKELKWKDSPEKARGTLIHTLCEEWLKCGEPRLPVSEWPESAKGHRVDEDFVNGKMRLLLDLHEKRGWELATEAELAVDRSGMRRGWWDKSVFARCKADVMVTDPSTGARGLIDWKTGKVWDTDAFQQRMQCFILSRMFPRIPRITWMYFYIDEGDTHSGEWTPDDPLDDVVRVVNDIETAFEDNEWPATKNKFCHWCDLTRCEHAG